MIKALIYDCVGPILVKKNDWQFLDFIREIDQSCGQATNDDLFWQYVRQKYSLNQGQVEEAIEEISSGYEKNLPMWHFLGKIYGQYQLAMINNGTYVIFKKWIKKFTLDKYFSLLLNSAQIGVRKPDKEIFLLACQKLEANPDECLFIDDSEKNVVGAQQAGLKGIVYNPDKHGLFLQELKNYQIKF
ncbi:HAD-IA family hydrolase [Candidatus Beckwithbacteria bacterium]|nr:HAD-IA family hydrolase [Candidatus Beckwithbacteria bacterium]